MSKNIFLLVTLVFSLSTFAQRNNKNGQWLVGGDIGYSGGSNSSYFGIAPEVSYLYNNGFEFGGNIGYSRIKVEQAIRNIYSFGPIMSFNFNESYFVRTRYQYLRGTTSGAGNNEVFYDSAFLLGGGYINRFDGGGMVRIGAMFNVLYTDDSRVFNSPILPFASYSFGF